MERITVVKIGGNVIDNPAAMKRFLKEFAALEGHKILVRSEEHTSELQSR